MSQFNDDVSSLGPRIERMLAAKLDEDERFVNQMDYIRNLNPDPFLTDRNLRILLEDRELEINDIYLANFEKVNDQVQKFVEKIDQINSICDELTRRIQSNKDRTRDLLKRTAVLQNEKKAVSVKQQHLDAFFAKYCLTDEENAVLTAPDGSVSEPFFKTLNRLIAIHREVGEQLKTSNENLALLEISAQLQERLDAAYRTLYQTALRECRMLNVELLDVKITTSKAMECLQARLDLFDGALREYGNARRSNVVRVYIDALTKGAKTGGGGHKPIEHLSNEPIRYLSEMLAWIHSCLGAERELCFLLLRSCIDAEGAVRPILAHVTDVLCQPLKVRVEQVVSKVTDPIVLYRCAATFLHYKRLFEPTLGETATLVRTLDDLHELASSMFFGVIGSTMQRIVSNMAVPDYDLLPVNAVHQALLLLRDVLEAAQGDGATSPPPNQKEIHLKIFMHILDPLHQSIQLVCSNLHNPLDVAVYMLNCLNAIRSVVILYRYTESKLEMIKAQIDANEDVLVSEQASLILTNCDLMDVYTKSLAHRPNQGLLSAISGMEPARVGRAIDALNAFAARPLDYQCHQTMKLSSARIRESIERRTFENVLAAYEVIYGRLSDPANGYSDALPQLQSVDRMKQMLQQSKIHLPSLPLL